MKKNTVFLGILLYGIIMISGCNNKVYSNTNKINYYKSSTVEQITRTVTKREEILLNYSEGNFFNFLDYPEFDQFAKEHNMILEPYGQRMTNSHFTLKRAYIPDESDPDSFLCSINISSRVIEGMSQEEMLVIYETLEMANDPNLICNESDHYQSYQLIRDNVYYHFVRYGNTVYSIVGSLEYMDLMKKFEKDFL